MDALEDVLDDLLLLGTGRGVDPVAALFELATLVDEQGDVAPVVHDELRSLATRKGDGLQREIPIFLQ